jgi:hypothetical protein
VSAAAEWCAHHGVLAGRAGADDHPWPWAKDARTRDDALAPGRRGPYLVRSRFELFVDELVQPGREHHYGPRELEVFAWLAGTAEARQEEGGRRRRYAGVVELLSANPYVVNSEWVAGLYANWREELSLRFRYAVLFRGGGGNDSYRRDGRSADGIARWRADHGIAVGARRTVATPNVRPGGCYRGGYRYEAGDANPSERACAARLDALLGRPAGRSLALSLNSSWPRAVEVQSVGLWSRGGRYEATLRYGIPGQGSSWGYGLAAQGADEPLVPFVDRALDALTRLFTPGGDPPLTEFGDPRPARPAPPEEISYVI